MKSTSSLDVALVARIVEAGSLSAAARQLQLSPASVSGRLADLERRLGVPLFRRSNRVLRLTQEGDRYLALGRPALEIMNAAESAARGTAHTAAVTGFVRLMAPTDLGRQYVGTMVDAFVERHPGVHVALLLADEVTDLLAQDVDLAIRYGEMPSTSGTTTSRLADNHRLVCAAPAYLERMGRPIIPSDLVRHNCLCLRTASSHIRRWPVGRSWIEVDGDRSTNDGGLLRRWAVEGRGLILKSWWDVREDLAQGRLKALFADQAQVLHPLRLARPAGSGAPTRVSRLIEHLKEAFQQLSSLV